MNKILFSSIVLTSCFGSAYANLFNVNPTSIENNISLSISAGLLNGESKELVYDSGKKISQLDWKIKNVPIINGSIVWEPYSFLTMNLNGYTSLSSGPGQLDDYDWLINNQSEWSHHSYHPNTKVDNANQYDANIKAWFYYNDTYKVGLIAGYQENRISWTAKGGSYSYYNGVFKGAFLNEKVISYTQKFSMPYIGVAGHYQIKDFTIDAQFKYSNLVKANDEDHHYLRDLTFYENVNKTEYYGFLVGITYNLTQYFKVFTEFSYNQFKEGRGDTVIVNNSTGRVSNYKNNAGISNKNYTASLGLRYAF